MSICLLYTSTGVFLNISYISRLYELFDEFAETEYVLGIMGIPNTNYP